MGEKQRFIRFLLNVESWLVVVCTRYFIIILTISDLVLIKSVPLQTIAKTKPLRPSTRKLPPIVSPPQKFKINKGSFVCKTHFFRMNNGFITGSVGSNCSSPFHVGSTVGKRIRPVPRAWRHYFDNLDATSRYV